jgi:hypothetical protein
MTNALLSVISAMSQDGVLYFQILRSASDSAPVLRFLELLHTTVPDNLLIIWDGAPIHRSNLDQAYLIQN